MGQFDTNGREVISEHLKTALRRVEILEERLQKMTKAIKEQIDNPENVYCISVLPITHCEEMMREALHIFYEVAQCNGAVLVRGTDEETKL
jgi:hypothetical protein